MRLDWVLLGLAKGKPRSAENAYASARAYGVLCIASDLHRNARTRKQDDGQTARLHTESVGQDSREFLGDSGGKCTQEPVGVQKTETMVQ